MNASKKIILLIFLFQIFSFSQIKPYAVISQDDLKLIPIVKLSDIFQLLTHLDLYSTDGYRFRPNPGRDLTNSKNDIHIFINGTKVFYGLSEVFNINHLPIHPEQIDSIIAISGSVFYKNEYLQGIVLDFILKENTDGYKFVFTHSSGNEIGDPGPYTYTEFATENVDQVGPNTQALFGYRENDFSFNLNYLDRVFPATDSKILARFPQFVFENFQVRFFGASLDISAKSSLGKHYAFASFTKTGKAVTGFIYGSDLFFMENISREIPVETSSFSFNSSNKFRLTNFSGLEFDFNAGFNSFANSKYMSLPEFNNLEKWFASKLRFNQSFESLSLNSGINYIYNDIKDRIYNPQITHHHFSYNSEITLRPTNNLNQILSLSIDKISKPTIYRLQFYNQYDFNSSQINFSFFSGFKNNLFSYILIPSETEMPYNFFNLPKLQQIKFGYQHKPSKNGVVNIEFEYERETNLHIRLGSFRHYNVVNVLLRKDVLEEEGLNLTKGKITFSFEDKLSEKLSHRFFYTLSKIFSANFLVSEFYGRIPPYKFNYSISFSPSKDFILSANICHSGETEWYEYFMINEYQNPIKEPDYSNKMGRILLLNVSLQKTFWKDRVRINASIYNLLNNEIQYHPLGGVMNLIFYLKGEIFI